jgi:dolichol-phosphate mannosyltransferase
LSKNDPRGTGAKGPPLVSLVIPCYNESAVLDLTYRRLVDAAAAWGLPCEMLFIDDGSRDETWSIVRKLAGDDPRVRGLQFSRNFGHQAAVGAGLAAARGDAVVVLDADLQDPPELIQNMIEAWRRGADVVYAQRRQRLGESAFKRTMGYLFYRLLARVNSLEIPADTGDFSLMDRRVVDELLNFREHDLFWRGLRCWTGFKHAAVTFDRPGRAAGQTKYTLSKLLGLASNGLLSFSTVPLRLPLYAGLLTLAIAAGGGVLEGVARVFFGRAAWMPGLSAWGMGFLGGVQLLSLGVIGEYVQRIFNEARGRPRWIVAERVGEAEASPTADLRPVRRAG